jgi:hypothetical protein
MMLVGVKPTDTPERTLLGKKIPRNRQFSIVPISNSSSSQFTFGWVLIMVSFNVLYVLVMGYALYLGITMISSLVDLALAILLIYAAKQVRPRRAGCKIV